MKVCNLLFSLLLIAEVGYGATLEELQQTALSNRAIIAKYKVNPLPAGTLVCC